MTSPPASLTLSRTDAASDLVWRLEVPETTAMRSKRLVRCTVSNTWMSNVRWTPNVERWELSLDMRLDGERRENLRLKTTLRVQGALLAEAFQLCGTKTKPVLAQIHFEAGKAYASLKMPGKSQEQFHKAQEMDPNGIHARLSSAAAANN